MRTLRLCLLLLLPSLCTAQGFLYDAFDARSLAMESAPFAVGMGAAGLLFNPASAASRQGMFMNVGGMLTMRQADFSGTTTQSSIVPQPFSFATDNSVGALPQIGFAYGPSQMPLGFGISVSSPFQFSTAWPKDWPGSHAAELFDFHSVYTSFALGYRVNRLITVGGAIHIVTGSFSATVQPPASTAGAPWDGTLAPTGSAHAAGTGAAVSGSVIISPAQQFSFALGYMTGTNIPVKGNAQLNASGSPAHDFNSIASLPTVLTAGFDIHPTNALRIDIGVSFTGFDGFAPFVLHFSDSTISTQTIGPNLKNTTSLRLGIEYLLSRTLALRGGVGYTSSSLQDDSASQYFPDNGAFLYSAGIGYQFTKNIRFDLGYRGTAFASKNGSAAGYNGQYSPSQNLLAASIALAFEPTANPLAAPGVKK